MKTIELKFFREVSTLQELKTTFKTLILFWHPDRNASEHAEENTKLIIIEYQYLLKTGNFENEFSSSTNLENELLNKDNYINVINTLSKIDGLIIELVGGWLWISGNTYANKDVIKSVGCSFAPKKKLWYYRDDEYKVRRGGVKDIEDIKSKYGVAAKFNGSSSNLYAIAN